MCFLPDRRFLFYGIVFLGTTRLALDETIGILHQSPHHSIGRCVAEASYDSDFRARCLGLIDSDIVNVGMWYSLFIQAVPVRTVILLGLFHGKPTGIKELGAGILLSQAGTTLSLAVHMADRTLNHLDAIFGFIILNALIAGTTILLSTEEVLAARWMVYVASLLQLTGFVVLGVGLGMLQKVISTATGYEKFGVIWLGWVEPFGKGVPFDLWLYFFWRLISWLLNVTECFRLTTVYHQEEHLALQPDDRASTALSCSFVEPLMSVIIAAIAVQALGLEASFAWKTTGQMVSLTIASASVIRLVWIWFAVVKGRHWGIFT
jgi:hypothetical protein